MGYQVTLDRAAEAGAKALPPAVRPALEEVMTVLGLVPWNGLSINKDNPDGAVRQLVFDPEGKRLVNYLVLEMEQRVDVLEVQWVGEGGLRVMFTSP
ncbi:MAG: hypothetical protein LC808_02155 [Actinobacteria bacterium]|nr:hypothetical protein [Actinomycetota bacterium]